MLGSLERMDAAMQEDEEADYTDGEGLDEGPTGSGYVTHYYETDGDVESDYFSGDGLEDLQFCDDAYTTEMTGKVSFHTFTTISLADQCILDHCFTSSLAGAVRASAFKAQERRTRRRGARRTRF